ncbi:MAG: nuclease-related domain-containing protein [Gammaproteobacteria bacterium]
MYTIIVAGALVALGAFIAGLVLWQRRRRYGARLRRLLVLHSDARIRDVVIPDGIDGHIQIDNVLRTAAGFVIVDVVRVSGAVFGSSTIDEWTVMAGGRSHKFRNPVAPNDARVLAVRQLVPGVPVHGLVVLLGKVSFPKGTPARTVTLETLPATLSALPHMPPVTSVNVDEAWYGLSASAGAV